MDPGNSNACCSRVNCINNFVISSPLIKLSPEYRTSLKIVQVVWFSKPHIQQRESTHFLSTSYDPGNIPGPDMCIISFSLMTAISTFSYLWVNYKLKLIEGNSLAVQWLGLCAFPAMARVWSLVGELRSCKLLCAAIKPPKLTNQTHKKLIEEKPIPGKATVNFKPPDPWMRNWGFNTLTWPFREWSSALRLRRLITQQWGVERYHLHASVSGERQTLAARRRLYQRQQHRDHPATCSSVEQQRGGRILDKLHQGTPGSPRRTPAFPLSP